MLSRNVKLNRLARIKARKFRSRNPKLEEYLLQYWNYWFQCHGRHTNLWAEYV
jgi:hypothetical protein